MEKPKKNVLYNIFDINNNINAEININRPISHKKYFNYPINKKNVFSNSISKINSKINYRNQLNNQNKNNNNNFYSYNNIISDLSHKDNFIYNNENMFISDSDNLNINENQNYKNDVSFGNNFSTSSNKDDNDDEILLKKYNEVKKLHKLFDENIALKNEIKYLNEEILNIKNINKINKELFNNQGYKFDENSKKLKEKINELSNINKNNNIIISKLKKEKKKLEQELILTKKDLINKNEIINSLNEKCRNLQAKINKIIFQNNNILEEKKLEKIQRNIFHKLNDDNNNLILSTSRENNSKINMFKPISMDFKEKQKKYKAVNTDINKHIDNYNIQNLDSFEILKNQQINNKIPSTPSFKSFKSQNSLKDDNNEFINEENLKEKEDENLNKKYYENRYLYYFKLYQECRKNKENLEKENDDKEKLIQKFIKKINDNNKNDNQRENNKYNPKEYYIISDKTYGVLKWYLLKKIINYEDNDTYANLIWVPKIDIIELEKFNEYTNEDEIKELEFQNIIKRLEEKENIISKLNYKIEKLEKDIEYYKNNSTFSDLYDELFVRTKPKNKSIKKNKNS